MDRTTPLICVVEDDREIRIVLDELLSDVGYRVCGCSTAREAQERISVKRPDLLLLDNHLEQYAAGWNLLIALRTNDATPTMRQPHFRSSSSRRICSFCDCTRRRCTRSGARRLRSRSTWAIC
jgi:CheY-like chemotaxis protein